MSAEFSPRPYQKIALEHLLSHDRCALWAGMGMGKTVTTLTAIRDLQLVESNPVLALAPLRVATSVWPDECAKWSHLSDVTVSPVVGTAAERAAALRVDAAVYTMNYENLPWLVEHLGDRWPFKTIVADESTRLKSFRLRQGGVRAQSLAKVAHIKVKRFIELTGTPSPNGLIDLWGQAWMLDAGRRLGRTFGAFKQRWFRPKWNGYGIEPLPMAQEQIQDKLRDIVLTLDPHDWFDLRTPITVPVYVDLPAKARQLYRDMEREMFAQIEEHGIEAFNAASRTMKCLQMASGAIYVDETAGPWREVHDRKLQALESIVEEAAGAPLLVAYHFKHDLARLRASFPQARVLDKDPKTIHDWNKGQIPILLAHPESAGHGLNLQDGGCRVVFFSHWWALEPYLQIIERIGPVRQMQSGHDRAVWIYHIIACGTVDQMVMAARDGKKSLQDVLLEAMKRGC